MAYTSPFVLALVGWGMLSSAAILWAPYGPPVRALTRDPLSPRKSTDHAPRTWARSALPPRCKEW